MTETPQSLEVLDEIERHSAPLFGLAEMRSLWSERRLILKASLAGFLLASVLAYVVPKRYTAVAQLMPPDPQSVTNSLLLAGLAEKTGGLGAMAGDLLGLKSSGALFVGMLQSRTIRGRLVAEFELQKVYRTRLLEDARDALSRNTSIVEDRKSGIITLAVTDCSRERAAALANAYVNELNGMVAQLSTSSARREREFLEGRLQSVRQDLQEAETQFAQFSSQNNTLDIQQQGKAMLEAAGNLASQLIAAQSELEGVRQIYTDNNARVRELSARVSELRKELDKLSGQTIDGETTSKQPLRTRAKASTDMPYPSIRKLPLLGATYADYYRQMKTQETVYELLTEQYELAKVQEAKETPSVKVLDGASIPERKSYPPRLAIIAIGTLASFLSSTIWVLGLARWRTIDSNDERKVFVREVASTLTLTIKRWTQNRSVPHPRIFAAFHRFQRPSDPPPD